MKATVNSILLSAMLLSINAAESQALQNVALNKPCTASSTFDNRVPATAAVDGVSNNPNAQFYHSGEETAPKWWEVDLEKIYFVRSVKLFSRPSNQFYIRLQMFSVLTSINGDSDPLPGGSDWKLCFFQAGQAGEYLEKNCPSYPAARYVAIYTNNTLTLNIAEVEVYAEEPSLVLQPTNGSCLNLTWPSLFDTDPQLVYMFRCASFNWTNTKELTASVCNLSPGSDVTCSLGYQPSDGVVIVQATNVTQMFCAEPSTPTVNYTQCSAKIAQEQRITLVIGWNISAINCNTLSDVTICASTLSEDTGKCLSAPSGSATIENLYPFRNYTLSVMAVNNQNLSSELTLSITTMELKPHDAPRDFRVISVNNSCGQLSWKQPLNPNGIIIGYTYWCSVISDRSAVNIKSGNTTAVLLTNQFPVCCFPPLRRFSCSISAFNSAGSSPPNSTTGTTDVDDERFRKLVFQNTGKNEGNVSITLAEVKLGDGAPEIKLYQVIVAELREQEAGGANGLKLWSVCNKTALLNYNRSREHNLPCYITAEINTSALRENFTLVLGDGATYSGYFNAPLRLGCRYIVTYGIGVELEDEGMTFRYSVTSLDSFQVLPIVASSSPPSSPESHGTNTSLVVGVVIGLLMLMVMTLLLVIFLRRRSKRNSGQRTKNQQHPVYQVSSPGIPDTHPYEVLFTSSREISGINTSWKDRRSCIGANIHGDGESRNGGDRNVSQDRSPVLQCQPSENNDLQNCDEKGKELSILAPVQAKGNITGNASPTAKTEANAPSSKQDDIEVDLLSAFLESRKAHLLEQFERLNNLPKPEMLVALLPENKGKSRYKGLYPVDDYRVKLDRPRSQGTDYVNASYIQGYKGERQFIAAQGPTAETINDFWLMIWQQKVSAVVMVTNLCEDGKIKCEKYWPDQKETNKPFGEVIVKMDSEELWADFALRTFRVTNCSQSRLIRQFHYLSWPDHGVPSATSPFVMFYQKVVHHIGMLKAPLLVHCSSGVGRTGTFIAVDYLLAQAKDQGLLNAFDCIKRFRERRPSMVQTEEQYMFVHKALLEALITREFISAPSHIAQKLSTLGSRSEKCLIKEEFMHIQKVVDSAALTFTAGQLSTNTKKNRYQEVIPHDSYRVYLSGGQQDYINAITVDGYRNKGHLIVTQFPLSETVSDFWRMVSEQGSHTIIQLGKPEVAYFPTRDESDDAAHVTIKAIKVEPAGSYKIATLLLIRDEDSVYRTEKFLKVFEVDWPEDGAPPSADSVIEVLLSVEKWQQQSENHKIVITCLDGASFSGVFSCAFNSLERLKAEQDIDVYHPVVISRLRRPQFVASMDQYAFIYKILKSYTESFSDYSNFI